MKKNSFNNNSNIDIILKTYLDNTNCLVYKVIIIQDNHIIKESEEFKNKFDASVYFDMLKKEYGL